MERTRRRFVAGAVVGVGGLLAGCIGSSGSGESSTTAATDGSNASTLAATTSDPPAIAEPTVTERTETRPSTGGSASTTATTTAPRSRTDSPTTEPGSSSPNSSTPRAVRGAPTSPTTDLEIVSRNGPVAITEIEVGPPGTDPPSVFREYVEFENTSDSSLDFAGYTVNYGGAGKSFEVPDDPLRSEIDAGGTLRVTTGSGGETIMPGEHEFFAGFDKPVLESGRVITVTDPDGTTAVKARY